MSIAIEPKSRHNMQQRIAQYAVNPAIVSSQHSKRKEAWSYFSTKRVPLTSSACFSLWCSSCFCPVSSSSSASLFLREAAAAAEPTEAEAPCSRRSTPKNQCPDYYLASHFCCCATVLHHLLITPCCQVFLQDSLTQLDSMLLLLLETA